jgi:hypothetical protein
MAITTAKELFVAMLSELRHAADSSLSPIPGTNKIQRISKA